MKIVVKDLTQKKYELETEDSTTILALKERLSNEFNVGAPAQQKIILKGKILQDTDIVSNMGLTPTDFFVVMVSKKKEEPKKEEPKKEEVKQEEPKKEEPKPEETKQEQPQEVKTETPTETTHTERSPDSSLVLGAELDNVVNQLIDMGFEKQQVVKALKAAYYNPERAVDYLFNGIPPNVEQAMQQTQMNPPAQRAPTQPQTQTQTQPQPQTQTEQGGPAPLPNFFGGNQQAATGQPGALDFLRNNPQFQQMRNVVQSNPQLLQPLLQQIGQSNPQLLQLITENQEEFIRLINEGGDPAQLPPNAIQVTPEEKEAIERLEGLGFERSKVIEAFFACDKNETLAANYLFDHATDED